MFCYFSLSVSPFGRLSFFRFSFLSIRRNHSKINNGPILKKNDNTEKIEEIYFVLFRSFSPVTFSFILLNFPFSLYCFTYPDKLRIQFVMLLSFINKCSVYEADMMDYQSPCEDVSEKTSELLKITEA